MVKILIADTDVKRNSAANFSQMKKGLRLKVPMMAVLR